MSDTPNERGWKRVGPERAMVCEVMHLARSLPMVSVMRRFDLGALHEARAAAQPRVSWTALLLRAMALLSARRPELRQVYRRFPWPHLYQHDQSVGMLAVQRQWRGRDWLFLARIRTPEDKPLALVQQMLEGFSRIPVDRIDAFTWVRRLAMLPWPARRLLMWLGYHGPSVLRVRHFGTFGISSLGHLGSIALQLPPIVGAVISCGPIDERGRCEMVLAFDHRLFDGTLAAKIMTELEAVLSGEILGELRQMTAAGGARP